MTRFKPHELNELRRECGTWSAWTPRQFADIASGFDPRVGHANTEFYDGVLGTIMVAVQVPDSTIPIIDNVRWPEIAEEIVYRNWPL